ncbi:hypothetical protein EMCRGX_G034639 [Ephydatia muelleri]
MHSRSDLFCSLIVKKCFLHTGASGSLKEEISSLKSALNAVDMTEEFAKYARLQRKLKEKERELITQENKLSKRALCLKTTVRIILFLLIEGVRIYVIVRNRYSPVLIVDPVSMWPITNIISYPMKIQGAVSPTVMMITSRQAIKSIMNFLPNKADTVKVKGS